MAAPTSKAGRDGDAQPGNKSLWLYRVACISMLIYIVATSNSNARMVVQQVHLATRASVSEAAALELCAAKGWVDPRAKQAAQPACPACPACECHCEAEACPQCPAAPDAAAVAAAKASANPPVTTFCPWSAHQSVFKGHDQMVSFGRNESVCADTIIYGYDMLFEYQKMWGQMFWMGVPFEQDPTDLQVIQEVLWDVRPDVLIELGTNTGGGALALASLMHLIEQSTKGKPEYKRMRIITIDPNDFHNPWFPGLSCTEEKPCKRPDTNPLWKEHVTFIQGLPTDTAVLDRVRALLKQWNAKTVMVSEDSSHAYHHVMPNLQAYKEFVTVGSYLLVQDTKTTRMGKHHLCSADGQTLAEFNKCYQEKKHGPLDAVHDFLAEEPAGIWENDKTREYMLYSQHADGWLKRLNMGVDASAISTNNDDKTVRSKVLADVGAWAGNVGSCVAIVFVNKLLMNTFHCHFATTLTALHFLACSTAIWAAQRAGKVERTTMPFNDLMLFTVVANVSVLTLNLSLMLNTVSFYQIAKLLVIPFVCFVESSFLGYTFTRQVVASILLVAAGVAVVTVQELQLNVSLVGLVIAAVSVVSSGSQQILVRTMQQKHQLSAHELLSNTAPAQAWTLLLVGPFLDKLVTSDWVFRYTFTQGAAVTLAASCALAVLVNISQFMCLGRFSAVSFQVLGHSKTILVLLGGWAFLGDTITSKKFAGMAVAVAGMVWYGKASMAAAKPELQIPVKSRMPSAEEEEKQALIAAYKVDGPTAGLNTAVGAGMEPARVAKSLV